MSPHIICSVFEASDENRETKDKNFEDMDPDNRVFLKTLQQSAKNDLLNLSFKIHPFDRDRKRDPEIFSNTRFDADFAICMYPNLQYIGPEIGHLLLNRRNSYHHLFIVTQNYLPDEDEIQRSLSTITTATISLRQTIETPCPTHLKNGEEQFDAEAGHALSFWRTKSIRKLDKRRHFLSLMAIT